MPTTITVVSDLHAGSTWGLCPPEVELHEEGTYHASKYQRWLWDNWIDFWTWARELARGRRVMVINGDMVDGVHHRTTQLVSTNEADHIEIADQCIRAAVEIYRPRHIVFIRGTEVHVGAAARDEEIIAHRWRKYVPHEKPFSRYAAFMTVEGVLFHFAHHTGGWGRPWTATGAPGRESVIMRDYALTAHMRTGEPVEVPDVSVRAHQHRFNDSGRATHPRVIVCPAWQLSTVFGKRISPTRAPDIGGVQFVVREGKYTIEERLYHIPGADDARIILN